MGRCSTPAARRSTTTRAHGGDYNGAGRVVTCHGLFPGKVEASLVANSGIDGEPNPCSLLAAAVKYAS